MDDDEEEKNEKPQIIGIYSTRETFKDKYPKFPKVSVLRSKSVEQYAYQTIPVLSNNLNTTSKSQNKNRKRAYSLNLRKTIKLVIKPEISAQSYCVMFGSENETILSHNQDQPRPMASLTKLMTAFTVINICNTCGIKIRDHNVIVQQQASLMEGTSANLTSGDSLSILDLLYGLLLPSGNDAGIALAQYFGKFLSFNTKSNALLIIKAEDNINTFEEQANFYDSEYRNESIDLFVFEMNKNSFKMGLKKTKFRNPTGLNNANNYSTANDLALLTSFCLKNHVLRAILKRKVYKCTLKNEKMGTNRLIEWRNTNKHLFQIRDCIGGKTGITTSAGPCLSSVYRIMGKELIIILLKSLSMDERYLDAENIYRWVKYKIFQQ